MNNFYEIQFPSDIAYGATGGPEFLTDIYTASSGIETRNINWNNSRCRYNLAPAIKTKDQLDIIVTFFRICKGKAIGFRFKDWMDYSISKQKIDMGDGNKTEFQVIKTYIVESIKIERKIAKPVKDRLKIYVNNVQVKPHINYTTGKIIFETPPAKGSEILVEGEFDIPVRFDIDKLTTSIENHLIYSHYEIPLIELKL